MDPNISKWINNNKFPLTIVVALFLSMVATFATYECCRSQVIKAMYESGFFQQMAGQTINYSREANWFLPEVMRYLFYTSFFFALIFLLNVISRFPNGKSTNVTPIEWFCLMAGLFLVQWYSWTMDDAYIFLRYIDNLLFLKIGLVYNKGEYVEGFSSPLWLTFLTLLRKTEMHWKNIYRLTTLASFVSFWLMLVKLNRRLSHSPSYTSIINFSLVYLTFNYAVLSHFSSGMETPLVQVLAVAYALFVLNPGSRFLQVLLALSPLVRHELIIPFVFCSIWSWRYYKKFPMKMVFIMIAFVGSWVLFRIYYYADLFPNTFYLKNVVNIRQGLIYVHHTLSTYHFYSLAILFVILIILLKMRRIELDLSKRAMMILTAIPIVLYVVKIGGDWVHYRYLAFPFILVVCSFSGILESFFQSVNLTKYRLLAPLAGIFILLMSFSFHPVQHKRHPFFLSSTYNRNIPDEKSKIDSISDNLHIVEEASSMQASRRINFGWFHDMKETAKNIVKKNEVTHDIIEIGYGFCEYDYVNINKKIIHGYGLTDAILSRIQVGPIMPGHNVLHFFAYDIFQIQKSSGYIGSGMYRKAVEEGIAPTWIIDNLDTIEVIERKIYNKHRFVENLKLALALPLNIKLKSPPSTKEITELINKLFKGVSVSD